MILGINAQQDFALIFDSICKSSISSFQKFNFRS